MMILTNKEKQVYQLFFCNWITSNEGFKRFKEDTTRLVKIPKKLKPNGRWRSWLRNLQDYGYLERDGAKYRSTLKPFWNYLEELEAKCRGKKLEAEDFKRMKNDFVNIVNKFFDSPEKRRFIITSRMEYQIRDVLLNFYPYLNISAIEKIVVGKDDPRVNFLDQPLGAESLKNMLYFLGILNVDRQLGDAFFFQPIALKDTLQSLEFGKALDEKLSKEELRSLLIAQIREKYVLL